MPRENIRNPSNLQEQEAQAAAAQAEAERRAKEAAHLVSVYLSGDLVDRLGEGDPKEAKELTEFYTTLTQGWKANPGLHSAGATPERKRAGRGKRHRELLRSTEKDSEGSSSAQSEKSAMHGFQLTHRHAYVWEKWELGVEALK